MDNSTDSDKYQENSGQNEDSNFFWYILSFLSWTIFIALEFYSLESRIYLWNWEHQAPNQYFRISYFPLKIQIDYLQTFIFIISLIAFINFFYFTAIEKNGSVYNGLMGEFSKFHFIPLLIISALNILSINGKDYWTIGNAKHNKIILIFYILFIIFGLISLIFVYIKTEFNEWYNVMIIKKGLFSIFIILLFYLFFYTIICLRAYDVSIKTNYTYEDYIKDGFLPFSKVRSFYKVIGISFSLIIGIGAYIFSLLFKDIMASFMAFLIYLGLVLSFFGSQKPSKSVKNYFNKNAEGIIYIIMMILTLIFIGFLIMKYNNVLM